MKLFKTSSSFGALLAAAVIFSPNFAKSSDLLDGLRDPAPAETQAQVNHTGIWAAALGGYQFSNSKLDFDYDDVPAAEGGGLAETLNAYVDGLGMDGFVGEAQIGYDQQINERLLVGIFAGYGINNAEFDAGYSHTFNGNPAGSGSLSGSQDWHGVLGARVGLIKSPDTMFYGAGGWAFGELNPISLTDSAGVTTEFTPEEKDLSGWFAELGVEHRLAGNIFGTLSGRYTSYGANTIVSGDECLHGGQQDDCSYALSVEKDDLSVMIGLKAKIGGF